MTILLKNTLHSVNTYFVGVLFFQTKNCLFGFILFSLL